MDKASNDEDDKEICDVKPTITAQESEGLEIDSCHDKQYAFPEQTTTFIHSDPSSLPLDNSMMNIQESSVKSIRPTQSHPKMSRMPRPPAMFKVGRTTRSLGSISLGNSSENSFGSNSNTPRINIEEEHLNQNNSSSAGASTTLHGKKGSGSIPSSKQINSQDSLKSGSGRNPQTLFTMESPIDSKGS